MTVQGGKFVVVEVPGDVDNRRQLEETVKRQAQLRFRLVACSDRTVPRRRCSRAPATARSSTRAPRPRAWRSRPRARGPARGALGQQPSARSASRRPTRPPDPTDDRQPRPPGRDARRVARGHAGRPGDVRAPDPAGRRLPGPWKAGADEELLAWQNSPDQASVDAFNAFTCPTDGTPATLVDDPNRPIVSWEYDDKTGTTEKMPAVGRRGRGHRPEGRQLRHAAAGHRLGRDPRSAAPARTPSSRSRVPCSRPSSGSPSCSTARSSPLSASSGVIPNGEAQISGDFTEAERRQPRDQPQVRRAADRLRPRRHGRGHRPVARRRPAQGRPLAPGAIGLVLVMLYCLLYYRGLGLRRPRLAAGRRGHHATRWCCCSARPPASR